MCTLVLIQLIFSKSQMVKRCVVLFLALNCLSGFPLVRCCLQWSFSQRFKSPLVIPAIQMSSVWASQPSHRDSLVQTLAPFGQTPLQRRVAECTEPHSELHIHPKLQYKHMVTHINS